MRCISYYSYIKPQLKDVTLSIGGVVYRTIPTSNHNVLLNEVSVCVLYIVLFLHQTTTVIAKDEQQVRCISYYSYIKPQPIALCG